MMVAPGHRHSNPTVMRLAVNEELDSQIVGTFVSPLAIEGILRVSTYRLASARSLDLELFDAHRKRKCAEDPIFAPLASADAYGPPEPRAPPTALPPVRGATIILT